MPILGLVLVVVLFGFLFWLVATGRPLEGTAKTVAILVLVVIGLLIMVWLIVTLTGSAAVPTTAVPTATPQ